MKILPIVTSLIVLGIASPALAQPAATHHLTPFVFKSFEARYVLRYDGIPFGKSKTVFNTYKNNRYKLCIENKTTLPFLRGAVTECSTGFITPKVIKPLQYDYEYSKNNTRQHIRINFDWSNNKAFMTTATSKWHIGIPHNTQDKISYQLLLRRGVAQGQTNFSFPVADGGKLKTYGFKVENNTNNTDANLIQLIRNTMPSKENVILWLRADLDYVVSKVKQNKNIADIGTAELVALKWPRSE